MSPDALPATDPGVATSCDSHTHILPDGWIWASLAQVTEINPPTDFSGLAGDAELPFIPMAAVAEETGAVDSSRRRSIDTIRKGFVRFREADVIFAKITPCMENGKSAPVLGLPGTYAAGSTEFHVLRPRCVDTKYLWYWLVRREFRQEAKRNMSGSAGQLRVPADYLRTALAPIAPLNEQRRIVARIDELFAEVREGEAALERARRDLDKWRRALLKAAVTGDLTRDWREGNRPTETGHALLARIRADSERSNSSLGRGRRSASLGAIDSDSLPAVPPGWASAQFADLGEIVGGVTVDQKRTPAVPVEVPYLRVANVQRGHLDLAEIKSIRVERDVAVRLQLRVNDVLLNEGGDRDKIGRGWVWQGEVPSCIHQNHVFRARLHESINPYFVSHYANEMGRQFFMEKGKQTTNLASISLSKIGELPVPVPPAIEASVAVDRLHEALGAEVDVRRELTDARRASQAQRQSILRAAFEGRLVPQDPADEPASALLARLQEAGGARDTAARRRGRRADSRQPVLLGLSGAEDPEQVARA